MNPQIEMFDVCAAKHQGNKESRAANLRARPSKKESQEVIYKALVVYGPQTCKELAERLGKEMHAISGRITELKAMSRVEATNETRKGSQGAEDKLSRLKSSWCHIERLAPRVYVRDVVPPTPVKRGRKPGISGHCSKSKHLYCYNLKCTCDCHKRGA